MKKLNITFCSFPDFGGNPKALYEYMVKRYKDQMNYTWVVYNKESYDKLKKKNINVVLMDSEEFKEYIPKTNVFFTAQGNLDADKAKTKDGIYIELWHGIGPKPTGFCQDHPSEEDIRGYQNIGEEVDYIIVPSEFWRPIFSSKFKVELSRIKPLGMPIFDYFRYSNGKEKLEKIINKKISDYKKVIMYMPTFKSGFNHNDSKSYHDNLFNYKEKYDENELNEYLKKNNYLLIYKLHPGEQEKKKRICMSNIISIDEKKLMDNETNVNEIINAFDLLITDYSSIGVEFLFLNKPVLYSIGDLDDYQKNRGVVFGNIDFWCPGPKCTSFKDLKVEMKKLLNDNTYYERERNEKRELWIGSLEDGGCDKICDFIFDRNTIRQDFVRRVSTFNSMKKQLDNKTKEINELKNKNQYLEDYNKILNDTLNLIYNSKSWKLIQKFRKMLKR